MAAVDEKSEKTTDDKILEAKKKLLGEQIATLGCEHKKTLATRNSIAWHLYKISQYDEALAIFKEVYAKRKDILGPSHDDTVAAQTCIARIYTKQDRLPEAVVVLKEMYEKYTVTLGPTHEKTQRALCTIGLLLQNLEKYDEAFEFYNKMYQGLRLQYHMARALRKGKYAEKAVEFFCKIHEKVLNNHSPEEEDTSTAKFRSGKALIEIKEHEGASNILEEVSPKTTKNLKALHKSSVSACRFTGIAFYKAGMINVGLQFLNKAYSRSKKKFGTDHKKSLKIQTDLISALYSAEKYLDALRVCYDMCKIQESKKLYNRVTYKTMLIIADIYNKLQNYNQANRAYNEAEIKFKGERIQRMKVKRKILFSFLIKEKDTDIEGVKVCYERYKKLEKTLGPAHPEALAAYESILVHSTKYLHLRQILDDVYIARKDALGANHVDTLRTGHQLADVHAKNHKYTEAMHVYREICEIRKDLPFTMSSYSALTNLAAMLCLMEKYEESSQTYEKRYGKQICEDESNGTHFEISVVNTLVKDDISNNNILNAFEKHFEENSKIRGHSNRVSIEIKYRIAEFYRIQEKYYDALETFKIVEILLERLTSFDPLDVTVLTIRNNVEVMYALTLLSAESYKVLEKHYERLKLTVGPRHRKCLEAQIYLAVSYENARKSDLALSHLFDVHQKIKEILNTNHPPIRDYEHPLDKLYNFIQLLRRGIPESRF